MTAILKQDPPELSDTVPSAVRQVVGHCLEKESANRFQSAHDLSFALAAMSQSGSHSGATTALAKPSSWKKRSLVALAMLLIIVFSGNRQRLLSQNSDRILVRRDARRPAIATNLVTFSGLEPPGDVGHGRRPDPSGGDEPGVG